MSTTNGAFTSQPHSQLAFNSEFKKPRLEPCRGGVQKFHNLLRKKLQKISLLSWLKRPSWADESDLRLEFGVHNVNVCSLGTRMPRASASPTCTSVIHLVPSREDLGLAENTQKMHFFWLGPPAMLWRHRRHHQIVWCLRPNSAQGAALLSTKLRVLSVLLPQLQKRGAGFCFMSGFWWLCPAQNFKLSRLFRPPLLDIFPECEDAWSHPGFAPVLHDSCCQTAWVVSEGCVLRVLGLKFLRIDGSIDPKDHNQVSRKLSLAMFQVHSNPQLARGNMFCFEGTIYLRVSPNTNNSTTWMSAYLCSIRIWWWPSEMLLSLCVGGLISESNCHFRRWQNYQWIRTLKLISRREDDMTWSE